MLRISTNEALTIYSANLFQYEATRTLKAGDGVTPLLITLGSVTVKPIAGLGKNHGGIELFCAHRLGLCGFIHELRSTDAAGVELDLRG